MAPGRRSRNPLRILTSWFLRLPIKIKAFVGVFAAIFSLFFIRTMVHNHDNLFVAAETIHAMGIMVLVYKLTKQKTCAGTLMIMIHQS